MMARPLTAPRFVRRTQLGSGEYHKNFRQIDNDVISALTSERADRVTPLMSKIYLRLVNAPAGCWERDGVLRFEGASSDGGRITAWEALCKTVGVASATANKALRWMHEQGIIGYFAGKNGAGVRIFLNRASSSIGSRAAGKKILAFNGTSSDASRTSSGEAAFNDSFADSEVLETDDTPRAPKNGADRPRFGKTTFDQVHQALTPTSRVPQTAASNPVAPPSTRATVPVEEIVLRLRSELESVMREAARQAASREHERTREWLESRGLPKAVRVAQHETYNALRKYGVIGGVGRGVGSSSEVGRGSYTPPEPQPLSGAEVEELAQACVAMLETQGQSIEVTLSKISSEAGGFLLAEEAVRVREKAKYLMTAGHRGGN